MTAAVSMRVTDFTGGPFAVSTTDGEMLNSRIAPLIAAGRCVSVSFAGVKVLMGAFLNAAFGALCGSFSDDAIRSLLTVGDLPPDGSATVDRTIQNARRYYTNRAAYDAAWAEEMGEDRSQQEGETP